MTETSVHDVMLRAPVVLEASASVERAHWCFDSPRVHMLPITATGKLGEPLLGVLERLDLPKVPAGQNTEALAYSVLAGRTVHAHARAADVRDQMGTAGVRRLAVVDDAGCLLGLLCLKASGSGFCSDAGVAAWRAARHAGTRNSRLVHGAV